MNQKLINIILGAGIAILLFLQLKNAGNAGGASSVKSDTAMALKLAYVDLDSIQEKYVFYKEKMQEFEKKKEAADRDLNNAFQKIEAEKNAFAQRGNAITQAEYENFQRVYQSKMQNLDQQKQILENSIAAEGAKTMEDLKKESIIFWLSTTRNRPTVISSLIPLHSTSCFTRILHKTSPMRLLLDLMQRIINLAIKNNFSIEFHTLNPG